jgi:hypothetical protein
MSIGKENVKEPCETVDDSRAYYLTIIPKLHTCGIQYESGCGIAFPTECLILRANDRNIKMRGYSHFFPRQINIFVHYSLPIISYTMRKLGLFGN